VGGGGDDVGRRKGRQLLASRDQARDVSHVNHEEGSNLKIKRVEIEPLEVGNVTGDELSRL